MVTAAIISLLIGLVLAQRFKVLVLIPFMVLTLFLTLGTALVNPGATWAGAVTAMVVIVALQLGYLFGIGVRHLMVLTRVGRRHVSLARSLPPHPRAR